MACQLNLKVVQREENAIKNIGDKEQCKAVGSHANMTR